jgi:hypothetical protein
MACRGTALLFYLLLHGKTCETTNRNGGSHKQTEELLGISERGPLTSILSNPYLQTTMKQQWGLAPTEYVCTNILRLHFLLLCLRHGHLMFIYYRHTMIQFAETDNQEGPAAHEVCVETDHSCFMTANTLSRLLNWETPNTVVCCVLCNYKQLNLDVILERPRTIHVILHHQEVYLIC